MRLENILEFADAWIALETSLYFNKALYTRSKKFLYMKLFLLP